MSNPHFAGKQVVVTGGTGSLGRAVVEKLLAAGAHCHLPVRSHRPFDLAQQNPDQTTVIPEVDLSEEASTRAFYDGPSSLWASIHCAGGFAMSPIEDTSVQEYSKVMTLNAQTAFLCCREAVRRIRETQQGGRIVNVVARPALEPRTGTGMVAYTASKAALAGLTISLAEETARDQIWVNAVAPSIMDSAANREAMPNANHLSWPTVSAVAETILFLASPANKVTRGALVPVYGSV